MPVTVRRWQALGGDRHGPYVAVDGVPGGLRKVSARSDRRELHWQRIGKPRRRSPKWPLSCINICAPPAVPPAGFEPAAFCSGGGIDPSACIRRRLQESGLRIRNRMRRNQICACQSMRVFSSPRTSARQVSYELTTS